MNILQAIHLPDAAIQPTQALASERYVQHHGHETHGFTWCFRSVGFGALAPFSSSIGGWHYARVTPHYKPLHAEVIHSILLQFLQAG